MLVLSRKVDEKIVINNEITITVLRFKAGKVQLGIEAPVEISVVRSELAPIALPDCLKNQPKVPAPPAAK